MKVIGSDDAHVISVSPVSGSRALERRPRAIWGSLTTTSRSTGPVLPRHPDSAGRRSRVASVAAR